MKGKMIEYKVYIKEPVLTQTTKKQKGKNIEYPKIKINFMLVNARSKEEAKKRVLRIINSGVNAKPNSVTKILETGSEVLPEVCPEMLPRINTYYYR